MENAWKWIIERLTNFWPNLIGALLVIWIGFKIVAKIQKVVEKAMIKSKTDKSVSKFVASIINFGLKILIIIAAAGMIGIQTTSFIAILWAAWLAVWLALQWSLSNFAGWVLILLFKPFKVGDYILAQGEEGTVDEISVLATEIITPENKRAIIPNGAMANGNIVNFTAQTTRRVDINVGIAYDEDIDKSRKVLEKVLENNKFVLDKPAPWVYVSELADSSVNLIVRGFAKPQDYWNTFFSLTEESKKALDKENISIPFPHRVVHTVSWTESL